MMRRLRQRAMLKHGKGKGRGKGKIKSRQLKGSFAALRQDPGNPGEPDPGNPSGNSGGPDPGNPGGNGGEPDVPEATQDDDSVVLYRDDFPGDPYTDTFDESHQQDPPPDDFVHGGDEDIPDDVGHWIMGRFTNHHKSGDSYSVEEPTGFETEDPDQMQPEQMLALMLNMEKGLNLDLIGSSINDEADIEAVKENTGSWVWNGPEGKPLYAFNGDSMPGQELLYHQVWENASTHGAAAYQPDGLNPGAEYFGPFHLDYVNHVVNLRDWNLQVTDIVHRPNRGNMAVGVGNDFSDASDSFIAGSHNLVRGMNNVILGGKDNKAIGDGNIVFGGMKNIAEGLESTELGGYENTAMGHETTGGGGDESLTEADGGSTMTGEQSINDGRDAAILAGERDLITSKGVGSSVAGGRGAFVDAASAQDEGGESLHIEQAFAVGKGETPNVHHNNVDPMTEIDTTGLTLNAQQHDAQPDPGSPPQPSS